MGLSRFVRDSDVLCGAPVARIAEVGGLGHGSSGCWFGFRVGSACGASNVKLALYRRTAQSGDTSVTITFSKTFAKAATLVVYRGVNPANPIDVSSNGTTATGSSVTTPSITTTKANDELVIADGAESASAGAWTAPSGMTTRVSQAGGPTTTGSIADQTLGAAGSTGSRTATFSITASLAAALVALQPSSTTYTYDALGDRTAITSPAGTTTLTYNQLGRMTAYGATTYAYNGDGLRMSRKVSRTTTPFTWASPGQSGVPLLLVDGSTDYVYGPNGRPLEQIHGSTVLYYLHDKLGSTRALTNGAGAVVDTYTYTPYGTLAASTGTATNPLGFAGAYSDPESGLLYLEHRYYDPTSGEFVSVDPLLGWTGAPYSYVNDNPINAADPAGLCGFLDVSCYASSVTHFVSKHPVLTASYSEARRSPLGVPHSSSKQALPSLPSKRHPQRSGQLPRSRTPTIARPPEMRLRVLEWSLAWPASDSRHPRILLVSGSSRRRARHEPSPKSVSELE